ncbi:MAG TPA: dihydropteroate synthase [Verrucomicrobiae bacterium]|nr:dihydropteroate synthase [Verrucomicrobiae bacterium]
MILRARQYEFRFPRPVLVMGIVNVTPDSFSDSGQFLKVEAAVQRGLELVRQGAEIIDVGGESSRPGAVPVSEAEELERVLPVIEKLAGQVEAPISIDTMKAGVACAALQAGASIVNDVGANRREPAMWELVAQTGAGYVCMHMQGTPATMQLNPQYADVAAEVSEFFEEKLAALAGCGVKPEQVILDPGIGFGKKIEHNIALLGALRTFDRFGRPLLVGVSRKSFLSQGSGKDPAARLPAALACACLAVESGVKLIRAHDVAETVQAIRMTETILASQRE